MSLSMEENQQQPHTASMNTQYHKGQDLVKQVQRLQILDLWRLASLLFYNFPFVFNHLSATTSHNLWSDSLFTVCATCLGV